MIPVTRVLAVASLTVFTLAATLSAQQHYKQTNLTSDLPGANNTDTNLVNAWGISRSSGSPWWVSDNGTGLTTLYDATGAAKSLVVTIPTGDASVSSTGTPTGQVFNGTQDFQLATNMPALFIFVTEDGTVSGWNPGVSPTSAVIKVNTHSTSVFKGLAVASLPTASGGTASFLYAADFRRARVAVYDTNFHRVSMGDDAFRDENVPHGFAPFNVQNIGGNIYVSFAKQDAEKHDEVDGAGLGYVDVFSPGGRLLHRLQHGSFLNAPWGMTQAPTDFGAYSHDILVGQFGSGWIDVFDPVTGKFKGTLNDMSNNPISINGLWGINFGNGATAGSATVLYFAAGLDDEAHGLLGTIAPVENTLGGDL